MPSPLAPAKRLVAFTDQLLEKMHPDEIRAVAAHEIAHIANQDMLAMVLLQGVVNSVVIAVVAPLNLARIVNLFSDDFNWILEALFWACKLAIAVVLTFLGSLMVKAFSRRRELRADALAASLCGSEPMIAALRRLDHDTAIIPKAQLGYAALKISGNSPLGEWLSTHPSIARRIAMLEQLPAAPLGETAA
jgi:heat shock protein HtpX